MNEKLFTFIHCLKFHQIIAYTIRPRLRASNWQQVLTKGRPWAPGLSFAVNVRRQL